MFFINSKKFPDQLSEKQLLKYIMWDIFVFTVVKFGLLTHTLKRFWRPSQRTTQPPSNLGSFLGTERPWIETDHSHLSRTEVINVWSYTSTPPDVFTDGAFIQGAKGNISNWIRIWINSCNKIFVLHISRKFLQHPRITSQEH